ncbi:porin family protein [Seonamhaeicola marinus]|uniref:PorT family protein n=1 Tax=Seonamhaeicola marinus TaxID=1912246 RepID=A0A5D0HS46_9FLAO|nr:porin family protein [Seonamhaeicola marinus]TYA73961.1 PorT family protein [Seonamhaeicola marinus]
MKNVILTLALVFISMVSFSQTTIRPGARIGANFANITNTEFDNKTDFYIGAFATIKFADFYRLQPEINYSKQGGKSDISNTNNLEINYLGLTLANKFSPIRNSGLQIAVGPVINFKTGDNYDGFDDIEGFDFGLMGGIGYELPMGLTIEARYNLGLVDLFGSNINNETPVDEILLNKVIQLGLSYTFNFGS